MLNFLKELFLISVLFPPLGFFLIFLIILIVSWVIGEISPSNTSGYNYDYSPKDYSTDYSGHPADSLTGKELMNYLADNDPKAYKELTDRYPESKTDYGEKYRK